MPAVPRTARIPYGPDDIVLPTKYRLIRRLGRGGFGEVWEAQNSFMDRIDAIKIFFPRVLQSGRYTAQQVAKEARIPNALRQRTPHVADVFDAGITDLGLPYIIMELLTGSTLREHIVKRSREKRPFDIENIVAIGFEVVHPLAIAHSLNIVHLDVKPDNIFLAKQHDQGVETTMAKLLDFGIAQLLEKKSGAGISDDEGLIGTTRYAAPEQFSSAFGSIGPWTDTYAAGHVLYEITVGHPTFEANGSLDRYALEDAQLTREPIDIREFRHDLPTVLVDLIHRCLRKRPADRPQSASELAAALSKLDEALRGKRSIVSIPAISDFDLSLDALALKLNTTTQRSPAPNPVVAPEPETAQFVQGPTYVSPHSSTEIPESPSAGSNVSESFWTEDPAAPAASTRLPSEGRGPAITVTGAPIIVGSGTEPLGLAATPVAGEKTLRLQLAAQPNLEERAPVALPTTNDALPATPSTPRPFPRQDKTDPDGPPLFFNPPFEPQRPPSPQPRSSAPVPLAATTLSQSSSRPDASRNEVFTASQHEEQAPPRTRLPRYPVLPGSGPMIRRATAPLANTSRPVAQRSIATEDRAPVVPLQRGRWVVPAGALVGIALLGIATGVALLDRGAAITTASSASSAPTDVSATTAAYAPAAAEASAPSEASASAPSAVPSAAAPPPAASPLVVVSARPSAAPSFVRTPRVAPPAAPPIPDDFKHILSEP